MCIGLSFTYCIEVYGPTLCTFCQHNESEGSGGGGAEFVFRRMKKQFNAGNETTRLVKSAEFLEQARDNYILRTNSASSSCTVSVLRSSERKSTQKKKLIYRYCVDAN